MEKRGKNKIKKIKKIEGPFAFLWVLQLRKYCGLGFFLPFLRSFTSTDKVFTENNFFLQFLRLKVTKGLKRVNKRHRFSCLKVKIDARVCFFYSFNLL